MVKMKMRLSKFNCGQEIFDFLEMLVKFRIKRKFNTTTFQYTGVWLRQKDVFFNEIVVYNDESYLEEVYKGGVKVDMFKLLNQVKL